jgi:hypothetical protein
LLLKQGLEQRIGREKNEVDGGVVNERGCPETKTKKQRKKRRRGEIMSVGWGWKKKQERG